MAHLLQGLILLAPLFNHKEALKTNTPCVTCHASIASSKAVSKNDRPVRWVNFPHELHLKLGNVAPVIAKAIDAKTYLADPGELRAKLDTQNACAACHRGMAESTALAKENYPHMADCLVCHNKIDLPFSCEKCHTEPPAKLTTADHTEGYIDRHSRKTVSKLTCAVCHGRKFTCLGCH